MKTNMIYHLPLVLVSVLFPFHAVICIDTLVKSQRMCLDIKTWTLLPRKFLCGHILEKNPLERFTMDSH